eukprot:296502_1
MDCWFLECSSWLWSSDNLYSNAVARTDEAFILCPDTATSYLYFTIVQYDTKQKTWEDFFKINTFKSYHNIIALNKKKKLLYVYNSDCKLTVIDLNSKGFMQCQAKSKYSGLYGSCLVINDEFHIFGGNTHRRHLIWNSAVGTFKKNYKFSTFKDCYINHSAIHIECKKIVLLMGGSDGENVAIDSIFCYKYQKNKWHQLSLKLPIKLSSFGCVVTKCEKYALLFGGYNSDKIYILNIERMEFSESGIRCPFKGKCYAVLVEKRELNESNVLVFGFIRLMYEGFKNRKVHVQFPSIDIIKMIVLWSQPYDDDYIHLLNRDKEKFHYKIALHHILNNHQLTILQRQ